MRFRHDLFLRCARGGCPDCGAAGQLKGLATIPDRCTACGMVLRRREGFFLGAMVWNYGLTAFGLLQGTRGDTAFLVELVRRMAARRN